MKKINKIKPNLLIAIVLVIGIISCKKTENGGIGGTTGGKGAPTVSSVRTVSKSTVDSTRTNTYTTYNSSGVATTATTSNYNPVITAFDSTTVTGKLGNYYAVIGTNLGSTTKILVNGVSVLFNRALNSDNSLIFSISTTVPYVQPQSNTIQIVTLYGSVSYPFTVLPPAPSLTSVSDYNFTAGTQLTLTGSGLSFVTAINLQNTSDVVTIVSKSDVQLVVKMPATSVTRAVLSFTYTSGTNSLHTASKQEFVYIDKAYAIFANGAFQNSWGDNSYAQPSGASATAPSITGKGGIIASYPAGGYKVEGEANYYPSFAYDPSYKYMTFWIKGGTVDHTLFLVGDQAYSGYGNSLTATTAAAAQVVVVPAKIWTYYKIPLGTGATMLALWGSNPTTATVTKQIGFFLRGSTGDVDETLYFDEILFVK